MHATKVLVITGAIGIMLAGCSGDPNEVMSAEFRTLSACLDGIKNNSGQSLDVMTDRADKVSGKLSNGETFSCSRKESGTKGVYFEGWYVIK